MCKIIVTIGLGFGDEGKGSVVDFLCSSQSGSAVVRYNGGPQAAHHVVTEDGTMHCFSQFGSGTFHKGVRTHLSRQMLIKPSNLLVERDFLIQKGQADVMSRLTMDPGAYLVTPWHGMLCRLAETARGKDRLGSVGMGVGQAAEDRKNDPEALTLKDLLNESELRRKLERHCAAKLEKANTLIASSSSGRKDALRELYESQLRKCDPAAVLEFYLEFGAKYSGCFMEDEVFFRDAAGKDATLVFEGAQGVLLDSRLGFQPYVTKTDVTLESAERLVQENLRTVSSVTRIGILRAYATRHGAGPFASFDPGLNASLPEAHNGTNPWQGDFRVGLFDLVMAKYGLEISGGVDSIALTCLDRLGGRESVISVSAYEYTGRRNGLEDFFEFEESSGVRHIVRIKPQKTSEKQKELTALLFECRPSRFVEFEGWDSRLELSRDQLPAALTRFVDFLEGDLEVPVSILSVGPTAEDKILRWSGV